MLVCFSSYSLRDRCIRKWKELPFRETDFTIYDKLDALKPIHMEVQKIFLIVLTEF